MINRSSLLIEVTRHVLLLAGAAIIIMPFLYMVSVSLKAPDEIVNNSGGFFGSQIPMLDELCSITAKDIANCMMMPALHNYYKALIENPLPRYLFNGVVVTASIFFIQVIIALPCAYALAKLKFWGRDFVFAMVMFCLLVPVHAIGIPLYLMLAKIGLLNSYAALIIPWTISVFGIFLMRQFFMTVPDDLVDAARMDGMSEFAIIWRVMAPTAIPALIAFAIFSVVAHWNDYFWPRIVVTGNQNLFTPPLGIREFRNGIDGNEFGPLMATATIIVIPMVAAFLLAQRRFIEGITLSGLK
ncbi:MAG: carbohydrate ABC transporter permease [Rhizobiaceae bacterium]|nr:carbohydrate ABC transporter permease [Rhizobiaceae bacterium]